MRLATVSVYVSDQTAAHAFYTGKLGFVTKVDRPVGDHRWLTVVAPDDLNGVELLLEPAAHPAIPPYQEALASDGIPAAQFVVKDVQAEYGRLRDLDVTFIQPPIQLGDSTTAVFDDTCGNLIQIAADRGDAF